MAAVRKGFITQEQVLEALKAQARLKEQGQGHKLIGMVMLELGMFGTTELIDTLKELNIEQPHPRTAR